MVRQLFMWIFRRKLSKCKMGRSPGYRRRGVKKWQAAENWVKTRSWTGQKSQKTLGCNVLWPKTCPNRSYCFFQSFLVSFIIPIQITAKIRKVEFFIKIFRSKMKKLLLLAAGCTADIENPGLVEPSKCEACKYFTIELKVHQNFFLTFNRSSEKISLFSALIWRKWHRKRARVKNREISLGTTWKNGQN